MLISPDFFSNRLMRHHSAIKDQRLGGHEIVLSRFMKDPCTRDSRFQGCHNIFSLLSSVCEQQTLRAPPKQHVP